MYVFPPTLYIPPPPPPPPTPLHTVLTYAPLSPPCAAPIYPLPLSLCRCLYVALVALLLLVTGALLIAFMFPRSVEVTIEQMNSTNDWVNLHHDNSSDQLAILEMQVWMSSFWPVYCVDFSAPSGPKLNDCCEAPPTGNHCLLFLMVILRYELSGRIEYLGFCCIIGSTLCLMLQDVVDIVDLEMSIPGS